jgi:hypothetical protein
LPGLLAKLSWRLTCPGGDHQPAPARLNDGGRFCAGQRKNHPLTFVQMGAGCLVNHVIQIVGEGRVVSDDASGLPTDPPESAMGMEEMVAVIDQRANYISPVLEHLLHLDHDTWPGIVRD